MQPKRQLLKPGIVALLLAIFTLVLLIATEPKIGLTWDEPAYIAAAKSYQTWFSEFFDNPSAALEKPVIDFYWTVNHEHPPMDKIWSGFVWSGARHVFDDLLAHRLGNMILVSIMVAVLYLWIDKSYGWIAGLGAVAALLLMPRFFFHAHLTALDVPAAFGVFMTTYFFFLWKDKEAWVWTLALGLVFSVAVATKVNALFVPPTLFLWALIFDRRPYLLGRLVIASMIGVVVSNLFWPWLYPDFGARWIEYIRFITVDHWSIWQFYLGKLYLPPPWHFPFVMLWAVVPLTITVMYFTGAVRGIREREQDGGQGVLFIFNALVPLLVLSIGQSTVYDNERLFMPTFPFLAALAGLGFAWIIAAIRRFGDQRGRTWLAPALSVGLALIVFLPPSIGTVTLYPHLLSYYSWSVGGVRGAAKLKLETTYWCETYAEALEYINQNAEKGDMIWVQSWSHDVLVYYQLTEELRPDIKIAAEPYASSIFGPIVTLRPGTSYRDADFVIFQYRQSYFGGRGNHDYLTPDWMRTHPMVYEIKYQGVPLLQIFRQN